MQSVFMLVLFSFLCLDMTCERAYTDLLIDVNRQDWLTHTSNRFWRLMERAKMRHMVVRS